jgi:hypothetical protein
MFTLYALCERGAIRVVGVVYATKKDDGSIVPGPATWTCLSDEECTTFGAIAGTRAGVGYGGIDGAKGGATLQAVHETHTQT